MGGMDFIFGTQQFGQFINYGTTIIWVIVGAIIIALLIFFVMHMIKFKHPVLGFEVVGDAVQVFKDRAALTKDKDTKKAFQFKLQKEKAILPPPPADAYIFTRQGKKAVMLAKISPTDYIYVRPSTYLTKKEAELTPIKQDVLFWYVQLIKKIHEKYSNEVKWYNNPMVISIVALAMCIVLIIITFKYNASSAATMAKAAENSAIAIIDAAKNNVGQVVT